MMKKKNLFALLVFLVLIAALFAGCNKGENKSGDSGGNAHSCASVCPVCGGCLNPTCNEEACKTKCPGHSEVGGDENIPVQGKVRYDFDIMAGYGIVENASYSSDSEHKINKVTNFNWGDKSTVTLSVYAEKETEADFTITLAAGESKSLVTTVVCVELNGYALESAAAIGEKTDEKNDFRSINLGRFIFDAGENIIKLIAYSETEVSSISLYCDEENAFCWTAEKVNGKFFSGTDDSVRIEGDYEKNVLQNCIRAAGYSPSKATFKIISSSDTKAELYIALNSMQKTNVITDYYDVRVNGEKLVSTATTIFDNVLWANYRVIKLGEVSLKKSENEISFSVGAISWDNAFNIRGICLKTEAELSFKRA